MSSSHISPNTRPDLWVHRLAILLAGLTFLMILVGGTVTTYEAGDSDPEWSLQFWEWFRPWSQMPGGQLYEITHRQIGTVIGFVTIVFLIVLFRQDRRWWVRYLGLLIFTGIVLQGVLGGLRVLVVSDPAMQAKFLSVTGIGDAFTARIVSAMVHAGLAQFIFGLIIVVALVTSRSWFTMTDSSEFEELVRIRRMALLTTTIVFVEMLLGAYVRHASRAVFDHVGGALLVSLLAVHLAIRVLRSSPPKELRTPAVALILLVQVQVFLGISSLIASPIVTLAPTFHVIGGSAIFASAVILTVRAYNLSGPETKEVTA